MTARNLTCFGAEGKLTRLYYVDGKEHVNELAWDNKWVNTDITTAAAIDNRTLPVLAAPGSALACFGINGATTRLYYVDATEHINELGWDNNKWVNTDITKAAAEAANAPLVLAARGSALACFGYNGTTTRLYYLDATGHVNELGWDNKWVNTDITKAAAQDGNASPVPAAPGSDLACFGVNGGATRLYYLDASAHINELRWDNKWFNADVTAIAGSNPAAPGSALTCFGMGGSATRLYYLDPLGNVNEMAWQNRWVPTNVTVVAGPPNTASPIALAASGSALTCFGYQGTDTRVYFLDALYNVHELAWQRQQSRWIHTDVTTSSSAHELPVPPGSVPVSRRSVTCFGVGGDATRLYYTNIDGYAVNELAWQNQWVDRAIRITATPLNTVAVPAKGLQNNSNYILYSPGLKTGLCSPLIGLIVTADITSEVLELPIPGATRGGYGFQLNASSSGFKSTVFQQYLIFLDPTLQPPRLSCQVNTYSKNTSANSQVNQQLINQIIRWVELPTQALPVGYRLSIALNNDLNGNITSATFTAVDNNGKTIGNLTISLQSLRPYSPGQAGPQDIEPILSFQLNIVAYQNNLLTTLLSGAGVITYSASSPLSVLSAEPPCIRFPNIQTLETSNIKYGLMPAGPSRSLTQSFQVPG